MHSIITYAYDEPMILFLLIPYLAHVHSQSCIMIYPGPASARTWARA